MSDEEHLEEESAPTEQQVERTRQAGIITQLIRLGGLLIAGYEVFFVEPPHDFLIFAIAGFMMAGATGIEGFFARIFGAVAGGGGK